MKTRGDSGVWPVYDDFKPTSEWQHDPLSHNLILHLPGFVKEQLRVSTEGRNTIRVRGERLVGGNKWSRFLQDFEVPENSDMDSVRAKFHESVLTITIPKKKVDKPREVVPQKGAPEETQQTSQQPNDTRSTASTSSPEEKHKHGGTGGAAGAFEEEKKSDETTLKSDDRAQTKEKSEGGADHGAFTKKAVAGTSQLNEERQLMVNMGVAALVVVSLTAWVTYKFVTAENKK